MLLFTFFELEKNGRNICRDFCSNFWHCPKRLRIPDLIDFEIFSTYSAFHLVLHNVPSDRILHLYDAVQVPFGPHKLLKFVCGQFREKSPIFFVYVYYISEIKFVRARGARKPKKVNDMIICMARRFQTARHCNETFITKAMCKKPSTNPDQPV